MNKTKELLLKIRTALLAGKISITDVPFEDIKQCVSAEIELYQNMVTEVQYVNILESYERLCADVAEQEYDAEKFIIVIDAMLLCIDMLSDTLRSLANREYWEYKHQNKLHDPQVQQIIEYIDEKQKISLLNYHFVDEYMDMVVELYLDEESQMIYAPYKGRKMYFPKSWDGEKISKYYCSVVAEQDVRSPHCYQHSGYMVSEGDVVVDVGAAEGIFALGVIDIAKKIYLIEADLEWIEALQLTFREDEDKVQIIYGFVDEVNNGDCVTLDALFEEPPDYIKMDIEGYEKQALRGAERLFKDAKNLTCAICSYHCREDEEWIKNYLSMRGFVTDVSDGYMCPDWTMEAYLEAELRRGIVFGCKK